MKSPTLETNEGEEFINKTKKIICEFCKKETCECKFLICPFHGKVNAKDEENGKFSCSKKDCEITREEKDLE